jgi:hypothetical protein
VWVSLEIALELNTRIEDDAPVLGQNLSRLAFRAEKVASGSFPDKPQKSQFPRMEA